MKCTFVVGQKVVCVAHGFYSVSECRPPAQWPRLDAIYTITAIGCSPLVDCEVVVMLKEITDGHWFGYTGFRPLQDRPKEADTDISIFAPLLNTKELVQ